jgi:hypothetical protein
MIVARVIEAAAKLATARQLSEGTIAHSLGAVLGLGDVDEDDLYDFLDPWLRQAQPRIEAALARKHLQNGCLALYDLTSSYLEGRSCELAQYGHNRRDSVTSRRSSSVCCALPMGVRSRLKSSTGLPLIPQRWPPRSRSCVRVHLKRVVLVGDRGMITAARIEADLKPAGLDSITALRAPDIRTLAEAGGPLQLSLFDTRDMAEITAPDYPGERLVVCRNPALAGERARKREDLLAATEKDLARVQPAEVWANKPLQGSDKIGLRVVQVLGRRKMAKHFQLSIEDAAFSFARDTAPIAREAALDGFYVLRTNVAKADLDSAATVLPRWNGCFERLR